MMNLKRRGFTLIELLVVIAIIGILASMVFPVFARARESARKAVCLSNVKNIALALQMYLADNNDVLPPDVHRTEVIDYFNSCPGGRTWNTNTQPKCNRAVQANPYMPWPVILEEYTKNREVWSCPSARLENGAGFIIGYLPDWLGYLQSTEGSWGDGYDYGPCYIAWPNGWGGDVTDSIAQDRNAGPRADAAHKAFVQSVGTASVYGLKMVEVDDPVNYYIVGDGGAQTAQLTGLGIAAYPDICALECANSSCGWADWVGCASWAADCGLYETAPADGSFLTNPELRKSYARHLGGVNVGFLDGHASWWHSDKLVNAVAEGDIEGISAWGPNTGMSDWDSCFGPGVPSLF